MSSQNFKRTKLACYFTYLSGAAPFALPPLLFLTFREFYGVSYTLLGTLVLVNFCTQLSIDLVFTFFTKHFNIRKSIVTMPLLTSLGLFIYALSPILFPNHVYLGLLTGTVLFSVSAGLSEVLLSPIIAAIPSDNPDRDMSLLHSLYAWGVVFVVAITTIFFNLFGHINWIYLTMCFATLPLVSFYLFYTSPLPQMDMNHSQVTSSTKKRSIGLMLCVGCIFLGAAAENVMTNWISGYIEATLKISKSFGDILGMASFALLLGFGRTLYAKIGRNISNVLLLGMLGSSACYLIAGFCNIPILNLIFCALTGFCSSMLWPGTLILMEEKIPNPGVAAYALMAAGGDFGSSIAPQLMGIVVDTVAASSWAESLSQTILLSPEQIGMKAGMIITAIFPIIGVFLILYIKRFSKERLPENAVSENK